MTSMRTAWLGIAAIAVSVALSACGERPQVINYKQGKYQGKPDTPPYASAPYNGNKAQWENAVDQRTQAQNEYVRLRD